MMCYVLSDDASEKSVSKLLLSHARELDLSGCYGRDLIVPRRRNCLNCNAMIECDEIVSIYIHSTPKVPILSLNVADVARRPFQKLQGQRLNTRESRAGDFHENSGSSLLPAPRHLSTLRPSHACSKALHSVISPSPFPRSSKCIFCHHQHLLGSILDNNNPLFWTVCSEPQRRHGSRNSRPTRGDSENHPEYSQTTLW